MITPELASAYSLPLWLADTLQVSLLIMVGVGATAVVLMREPTRQVLLLSMYGLALALLFLVLQAPDVTLSELAVGTVLLPLLFLLALAKVRKQEE